MDDLRKAKNYYIYYSYLQLGMNALPIISFIYNSLPSSTTTKTTDSTHEIIAKLKFIGMIKPGEKIDTRSLSSTHYTKFNAISRWLSSEDRYVTLGFLTSVINRAFEIINMNLLKDKSLCESIIRDLLLVPSSLVILQSTYDKLYNDRIFSCDLQTLIQCLDIKLRELHDTFPNLFISKLTDFTGEFTSKS